MNSNKVEIKDKALLTVTEASAYFGIGSKKLYELTNDQHSPYVIWVGKKRLIKRKLLESYLDKAFVI